MGRRSAAVLLLALTAALTASAKAPQRTVAVLMLSDLHFDPYHDPAKLERLRAADVNEWARILITPDSPTQAADFDSLQKTCHARGVDSPWGVLKGSLEAARIERPSPLFVTVSGDLLTHNFDCRMRTLNPAATAEDISKFAQKTMEFIALQLRQTFPGVPVYLAMGNNDSGCTNYHQSPGSAFVLAANESTAAGFLKPRDRERALRAFSDRGDYSALLPSPMGHTRLIVLQDVVQSPAYEGCDGKPNEAAVTAQVAWLRAQLVSAKKSHQHVWVMAHIPPGVDEFASFHKYTDSPDTMCEVNTPTPMLSSEALNNTLTEFPDLVRLAVFAHTHMDEIKLLHAGAAGSVPAKLVPSVTPVNGNNPAFTVAEVQPESASLLDYTVFVASDKTAGSWSEEYRYSSAYKQKDFSAASVAQLTSLLSRDKTGTEDASVTYQKWFFPGDSGDFARGLRQIWPSYACSTVEDGGPAYHLCMCPGEAHAGSAVTTSK